MARASKRAAKRTAARGRRKLDAFPDKIDFRDWPYQPMLAPLPDELVHCARVPEVLDQGSEGACTGFALAAVINYLLSERGLKRRVSPRMLYEMARCHDEWPGERYEGSSARGAMKGWARHGVSERSDWPDDRKGRGYLDATIAEKALATPCGAYYRVKHREVRDVHAALAETGAVYTTLMVHDGWDRPGPLKASVGSGRGKLSLPVIQRKGRAESGHAVALVGYARDGFVVQNSWGTRWGAGGFALLPYEDFLLHATDVWVAQLGVPLAVDLWARSRASDSSAGRFRGGREIPLAEIRPYIVDIGNNGELSQTGDYWTSEEDLRRLFRETIPNQTKSWKKKRVMLYVHGGLNSERDAAKRVVAFREKCLANEIYPLHLMWETGPLETLASKLGDLFTDADERAGGGFMEGMRNAKNRMLELTAAPFGTAMWSEMKENAWRASDHRRGHGAIQLMHAAVTDVLKDQTAAALGAWELHVVAHSAGSILFTHAIEHLCALPIGLRTVQFFAPAVRVDEFEQFALPAIEQGRCPKATLYILTEEQELEDTVGPYGHSLLWLVSNAFEDERGTPILGMKAYLKRRRALCRAAFDSVIEAPGGSGVGSRSKSKSHGGFDNDPPSMNSVLARILGRKPAKPFDERDLDYG